jgi:hypothetical protein
MPTGYTAKLMSEGESFEKFVMRCARAFGALVEMRDEPWGAEIPERFEPSCHCFNKKHEAEVEYTRLSLMSEVEREAFGIAKQTDEVRRYQETIEREKSENQRLDEMAGLVKAWNAPKDHEELKSFMLQQIETSRNYIDHWHKLLTNTQSQTPIAFFVAALSAAARDIGYYEVEQQKEIERVEGRNLWLSALRASIGIKKTK